MKKLSTIIVFAILFLVSKANATTIVIQAMGTTSANEQFSPQVANAVCGDTIRWVLVSGTHTTASTTIPAGATPWASNNLTTSGFIYVVTVAGTYNYTCHPQNGGHMNASIVVTCSTTEIPSLPEKNTFSVSPNPSNGNFTIDIKENTNCLFEIYNVVGRKVFQSTIANSISQNELIVPNGIYYYNLKSESKLIGKGTLVIQN
jgi:plastocyanin